MSDEDIDFGALYQELGVVPDCTPEEFRHAYRRRVARLHPDQGGSEADAKRLQHVNRLYDDANEFLRAHGRLPGARSPAVDEPHASYDARAWSVPGRPSSAAEEARGAHEAGSERQSRYFIWLAVLVVCVLLWHMLGRSDTGTSSQPADAAGALSAAAAPVDRIVLGMDKPQVRVLQGAPIGYHSVRWDYGPSWIDFGCGDVVTDWYSSPLRPLKVDTAHPTARDWDRFDAAPPAGC